MKCGIMGHFAKFCKTKLPKKTEIHQIKANEIQPENSSDEESFVFRIGDSARPVYPIFVENTKINMLIDSGSTLNILDETTYRTLSKIPKLQNSTAKIFTYSGQVPLKLKGTFIATVRACGKATQAKFYVTEGSNGAILGQKTAETLNILRVGPPADSKYVSVNEINQAKDIKQQVQNEDQDDESMYELPIGTEGNVTGSISSEHRLSRPSTSQNTSSVEDNNSNARESNLRNLFDYRENNPHEISPQNDIEVMDNRIPTFIPDETPIQIQRTGPEKKFQTKRRYKKR